jgi:hypothetical protein
MADPNRPIEQWELNDFFTATVKELRKNQKGADVITPKTPTFKRLEQRGKIGTRPPGHTYTADVIYGLPDRSVYISHSHDFVEKDYAPVEVSTQAQYNPVQRIDTLTLGKYEYDNNKGAAALTSIFQRKLKQTEKKSRNMLAHHQWYGLTIGQQHVFGIVEAVQFDPSSPPAAGNVGGLAQTGANSWWQNKAANFNAPFATVTSGFWDATNFLQGPSNSMLALWMGCTELESGDLEDGRPDLMPCNKIMWAYLNMLVDQKLIFNDTANRRDLGVGEIIHYRGMDCYYDPLVPDDPNSNSYGVGFFLNTNSFEWVWTEGLKGSWSEMNEGTRTAFMWDRSVQFCQIWENRAQNGVIYGVKNKTVA